MEAGRNDYRAKHIKTAESERVEEQIKEEFGIDVDLACMLDSFASRVFQAMEAPLSPDIKKCRIEQIIRADYEVQYDIENKITVNKYRNMYRN